MDYFLRISADLSVRNFEGVKIKPPTNALKEVLLVKTICSWRLTNIRPRKQQAVKALRPREQHRPSWLVLDPGRCSWRREHDPMSGKCCNLNCVAPAHASWSQTRTWERKFRHPPGKKPAWLFKLAHPNVNECLPWIPDAPRTIIKRLLKFPFYSTLPLTSVSFAGSSSPSQQLNVRVPQDPINVGPLFLSMFSRNDLDIQWSIWLHWGKKKQ